MNPEYAAIASEIEQRFEAIAADIHDVESAKHYCFAIGAQHEYINSHGFGDLFAILQRILDRSMVVSVMRIYEKSKKYPLHSIPATIEFLISRADVIDLSRADALRYAIRSKNVGEVPLEKDLTRNLCRRYSSLLPPTDAGSPIDALKQHRDKAIAHGERCDVTKLDTTTYAEIDRLVGLAKQFLIDAGLAFADTGYADNDGTYHLSESVEFNATVLGNIIRLGMQAEVDRRANA